MYRYDWTKSYKDLSMMEAVLRIQFKGEGWYKDNDTILIVKDPDMETLHYRVYVWNDRDPREGIRKVLELPTHKE